MSDYTSVKIGWASDSITPDRPIYLSGQLYERISRYVHDPLTATALVIEGGGEQCIMVSCDMVGIEKEITTRIQERVDGVEGIDGRKLTISAIHSHNASRFWSAAEGHTEEFRRFLGSELFPPEKAPADILCGQEAEDFLIDRLEAIVLRAWRGRAPGGISWAQDYAAIGFNRRPVFEHKDGSSESKMYGCCAQPDFKRFEGGVDHTANMLYTWDEKRNLTGVAVGIPCPSQVNELHYFVSGDYWTNARKHIREQLGNIYVLSLCEAAGDQNPLDLVRISKKNREELAGWGAQEGEVWCNLDPERECDKIGRRIADAVTRGWDDAREQVRFSLPFHHDVQKISLPLRKVSKADYDEALAVFDRVKAEHSATNPVTTKECVRLLFEPLGVIDRWELQQKTDVYQFEAHFIRIGDTVITTNPFELFVEYAFRVRARCKADQVFMIQLANDVGGYLPTQVAVLGGSYSSKPASTRVGPEGGDQLVEEYIKQIDQL